MDYYNTFQKKKILGHQTNSLSRGPNLTPRNYHFGRFYDDILLVYEAIKQLNVKKKEKKNTENM